VSVELFPLSFTFTAADLPPAPTWPGKWKKKR
jgi:hypothetical protein